MSSISVDALNILAYLSSKGKGRAWVYANCKKGSVLPDELSDRRIPEEADAGNGRPCGWFQPYEREF